MNNERITRHHNHQHLRKQCQAVDELCNDCQDLRDSRDVYVAHQIVDEGNLQYKHVWSNGDSTVSGHDWVGAVVRLLDGGNVMSSLSQ
jgi:hypothetical protein